MFVSGTIRWILSEVTRLHFSLSTKIVEVNSIQISLGLINNLIGLPMLQINLG